MGLDPKQMRRTDVLDRARPWSAGKDGELRRDPYSGVVYDWSPGAGAWLPYGSTDHDFTLYVDPIGGDDTDVGDVSNPLLTYEEAIARLPKFIRHKVIIDLDDDGGDTYTYDEFLTVADFVMAGKDSGVKTVGKDKLIAAIAADAGMTGDKKEWTVTPDPGWTTDEHVGRFILFTAGPRNGTVAWILSNTNDTLILSVRPFTGTYGPSDAGEIREVTTIIENVTLAASFFLGTIAFKNIIGTEDFDRNSEPWVFERVHFKGDDLIQFCLSFHLNCNVLFSECRIDDYVFSWPSGGGRVQFWNSLGWPTKSVANRKWFGSTPGNNLTLSVARTGFIGGGIIHNWWYGGTLQMTTGNCIADPINPANTAVWFFDLRAGAMSLNGVYVDCNNLGAPLYIGAGGNGELQLNGVTFKRSINSGILAPTGQSKIHIRIDEVTAFGLSDFADNAEYGIDASGPVVIDLYNVSESSTPNGIAGMRIREGAKVGFFGSIGNEPTMSGPGPSNDEIDFDDRSPAMIKTFAGPSATGLETMCRYRNAGV
jgi:hypothetical protein